MFNELRFAIYAIKKNIQGSAELRTSFLMSVIGMAISNTAFLAVWVFFVRSFGVIGGWQAADIVALLGFTTFGFGIVFAALAGFRRLPDCVSSGSFDGFLVSPKNLLVRIATSSFSAAAVGDVVFGVICLAAYAAMIKASLFQILLIVILLVLAVIVFLAITIIVYSASFYFTDAGAVASGFFELFLTPALFHGGAFQGTTRFVFTFIIPSLLIGTLPIEAVRAVSFASLAEIAVLAVLWFLLALLVFRRAVRHYESSNFITFGN
jgi:ABC-2 type transport system permease protein